MDYKQTVEWLKSYRDMYYRVIEINRILEGIDSPRYSLEVPGTAPSKTNIEYIQEKVELESAMERIRNAIELIPNFKHRTVLRYKFIDFLSLEKIAEKMNYSFSQTRRYYRKGINFIVYK